jgi:hypothetical protein
MASDVDSLHLEGQKLALDYVKHVTTVAATIIVVGATFLEKLQAQPSGTWLVFVTFVALLATVVSLVLAAVGVVNSARSGHRTSPGVVTFTTAATALGLAGFLVGIAALSCFVLINV